MEVPPGELAGFSSKSLKERLSAALGHPGFLEHRKFDFVGQIAKLADLLFRSWVLKEVIRRETQHGKPTVAVSFLKRLQSLELRGEAAVTGRIHHKQHLIRVGITEPHRLVTREESFGEIQIHRAVRVICVNRQSDQCEDCEQKCTKKHD